MPREFLQKWLSREMSYKLEHSVDVVSSFGKSQYALKKENFARTVFNIIHTISVKLDRLELSPYHLKGGQNEPWTRLYLS